MAKNITQRIVLSGAEEIRAALKSIGDNGNAAFKKLADVNAANRSLAQVGVNLKDLADRMKNFGAASKVAATDAIAFGGAVGSALARVTGLSAGLTAAATKLVGAFKQAGGEAEELQINADAAKLTRQEYEQLTLAMGKNGIGQEEAAKSLDKVAKFMKAAQNQTDDYERALTKLNREAREKGTFGTQEYARSLEDLREGMGEAAKTVQRYGVRLRDVNGQMKNAKEFAIDMGEGFRRLGDNENTAADALEVFGRAGRKIGQFFGQGREEISKTILEVGKLAPSLAEANQKALLRMDDSFDLLSAAGKSLKRELIATFAGDVTNVVTSFSNLIGNNRERFIQLAATVRAELMPSIERLLTSLNSPEAGDLLLAFFRGAADAAKALGTAMKDFIIPAFVAIKEGADQLAVAFNNTFGTKLTGGVILAGLVLAKFTGLLKVLALGFSLVVSSGRLLITAFQALVPVLKLLLPFLLTPSAAIIALGIAIGLLVGLVIRHWDTIYKTISGVVTRIIGIFTQFPGNLAIIWEEAKALTILVWDAIKAYFVDLWVRISQPFRDFPRNLAIIWEEAKAATFIAWDAVKQYFADLWTTITQPFRDFPKNLGIIWEEAKAATVLVWDAIKTYFAELWADIKATVQSFFDYVLASAAAPFNAIKNAARDMWQSVVAWFDSMIAKAKEYLGLQAAAGSGGGGGGKPQANAAGGYIRGRGTGTSDSILSWLSNGEFVVKARAVKHYGPNILHAINNMRMPRFANGGMARVAANLSPQRIPRFANGGMVPAMARAGGGGRPLVLQLGDQTFGGMTANQNAVESLNRYASAKAVRSAGRKPEWFKG